MRIIYGALVSASFVYLLVAMVAAPEPMSTPDPILAYAFGFVALSTAVVSFLLPRKLLEDAFGKLRPELKEETDPDAEALFRDQAPTRRVFADPAGLRRELLRSYMSPFILGLALSESIAIYGLVLRFVGHGWELALPFFVLGWMLLGVRFPTMAALELAAERRFGASFPATPRG
jgi:hypothetical protein